ncbi:MAG: non-canonical purine NTP pyrophosphatase, RdgB/HAM1 family [Myxococcales bacterium]|jgi:XTP/dITP diphosphohydrolase|nr:non-canonical purine NTP pyrophosphatase, RdgB/HAM1 family [Myxococcales bacterium]MBF95015.1 non-canonical purine NTP pyrophosphatase, RdgB/HAM1 family [Myxococcales bacterium]
MLERPRLVIATGNRHKIQEMTEVLGQWFVVEGLPKNYDAPEETGHDFLSNARIKSETASQRLNTMALADDSGICVDALDGAPGIYSARFAGRHGDDEANNDELLRQLGDLAMAERGAHYVCALSLADPRGQVFACSGEWFGHIGFQRRGSSGFGYDPLFVTEDGRTAAEFPDDEKRRASHRARALEKLLVWLEQRRTQVPG